MLHTRGGASEGEGRGGEGEVSHLLHTELNTLTSHHYSAREPCLTQHPSGSSSCYGNTITKCHSVNTNLSMRVNGMEPHFNLQLKTLSDSLGSLRISDCRHGHTTISPAGCKGHNTTTPPTVQWVWLLIYFPAKDLPPPPRPAPRGYGAQESRGR